MTFQWWRTCIILCWWSSEEYFLLNKKTTSLICQDRTWGLWAFCREISVQSEQQKGTKHMVGTLSSLCLLALCHPGTHLLLLWAKGETGNLKRAFTPANVIFKHFLHELSHFEALSDSLEQFEGGPKEMTAARLGYSCDWKVDNGWGGRGKCCCPRRKVIWWKSFAKPSSAVVESSLSSGLSAVSEPSLSHGELINGVSLGASCTASFLLAGKGGWTERTVV